MLFTRLCCGVSDRGKLIPINEDILSHISNVEKDWYRSVFFYNDDHFLKFKETKSIAGITDVVTNRLVWDFDSVNNVEEARKDTIELVSRIISKGVSPDQIQICFSGNKGFGVELEINKFITVDQFKNATLKLGEGLKTLDKQIINASRIFRVPMTKHPKTNLFKFPLSVQRLSNSPVNTIREWAKSLDNLEDDTKFNWVEVKLPANFFEEPKKEPTPAPIKKEAISLDFSQKPKFLTNCKYALLNGHFDSGTRNNALLTLCATFKNNGFPKEITYRMLKGAAELQSDRTGDDPFPKDELWNNIVNVVYGHSWKNGQHSCKTTPWLKDICESLGDNKCKTAQKEYLSVPEMGGLFKKYANNIDINTVKTGIKALDENVQLTIGMSVGILGSPSSGKTSAALDILNNTSKQGIRSAFFSLDMYYILVLQKMLHKMTGMNSRELYNLSKDTDEYNKVIDQLSAEYKNMDLFFKSGYTVDEIKKAIISRQEELQEKIKIVIIDYLECLTGPYADPNANMAIIANQLKDLATELELCVITLVQPQKSAGDPSSPLTSMRQVKGASTLEQAFSVILGIYREGFNPKNPLDDKFITVNALKNRMGPLFSVDCSWNGLRGEIGELSPGEAEELEQLRNRKKEEKDDEEGSW